MLCCSHASAVYECAGYNFYESLSGIETPFWSIGMGTARWGVTISTNPYQGLKQKRLIMLNSQVTWLQFLRIPIRDWNADILKKRLLLFSVTISTNPYQGLKQRIGFRCWSCTACYNFYESLSGIETLKQQWLVRFRCVTISTNPYQGLKLISPGILKDWSRVTISTNPYQGLKRGGYWKSSRTTKMLQFLRIPIRDWNYLIL